MSDGHSELRLQELGKNWTKVRDLGAKSGWEPSRVWRQARVKEISKMAELVRVEVLSSKACIKWAKGRLWVQ